MSEWRTGLVVTGLPEPAWRLQLTWCFWSSWTYLVISSSAWVWAPFWFFPIRRIKAQSSGGWGKPVRDPSSTYCLDSQFHLLFNSRKEKWNTHISLSIKCPRAMDTSKVTCLGSKWLGQGSNLGQVGRVRARVLETFSKRSLGKTVLVVMLAWALSPPPQMSDVSQSALPMSQLSQLSLFWLTKILLNWAYPILLIQTCLWTCHLFLLGMDGKKSFCLPIT